MIAAYLQHNDNYQSQTHQDTRDDTCHKHISDGNTRDRRVYNKRDTRRDDNRDGTGSCHQCRRERCRETAPLYHRRNQDRTQSRYRRRTGTGDRAEKAGYDDTHIRNAAFSVTDTGVNETDQARGNSRLRHDISR